MGFELNFHYYEKNPSGKGFMMEERKSFKKVLGKTEDIPLEKAAMEVMRQLARRDILVEDVDIFEFTKKPVSFKETKGGVVIKGQKFSLDGEEALVPVQEEQVVQVVQERRPALIVDREEFQDFMPQEQKPGLRSRLLGGQPSSNNGKQGALRMEIFDPEATPSVIESYRKNNIHLTAGKKYPIYEEKYAKLLVNFGNGPQEMPGVNYIIMDDKANKVEVDSVLFAPEQRGLVGMSPQELSQNSYHNHQAVKQPKLLYMNEHDERMPEVRKNYR